MEQGLFDRAFLGGLGFVAGASVGHGVAIVADFRESVQNGVFGGDMTSGVRDPREISRWDEEVDVLVLGLGAAGACAALEASRAGAETLVLERAGGGGGTSAMSGGVLYLGGGTGL